MCLAASLVVEADGAGHTTPDQADYDAGRSALLHELGYRVLRFSNEQVMKYPRRVVATIEAALTAAPGVRLTP